MLRTGSLQQSLMLVGKLDVDLFEAGSERANLAHGDIVFQELVAEVVEIEMIVDERMDGLSEDGGAADARNLAGETKRAGNFGGGDFHAHSAMGLDVGEFAKRIGRAISDELSVINIGDVAAALGLVHVMGGYEKGDAVTGKLEQKIPELAARDGVDSGRGLIEEKKLRLVQHGAAESEALLPAPRKLRGKAIQIGCEAIEADNFVHQPPPWPGVQHAS